MVAVIPRSAWGSRYPDGGGPAPVPYTEFWLHHSVTIAPDLLPPFDDEYRAMRTLEDIGQQRFGQGISYTWPIMPNGRIYQGHSVNRLGAHTGGRNSVARAICLVGNYDTSPVTAAQIEAAAQLMVQEYRAGRATRYTLNGGHRQLKATSCPGDNGFAAIPTINARARAIMAGGHASEDDMPASEVFGWPLVTLANGRTVDFGTVVKSMDANLGSLLGQVTGLNAAVGALAGAVADGRDDLTAADLEAAVKKAILDAGAALRVAEGTAS